MIQQHTRKTTIGPKTQNMHEFHDFFKINYLKTLYLDIHLENFKVTVNSIQA